MAYKCAMGEPDASSTPQPLSYAGAAVPRPVLLHLGGICGVVSVSLALLLFLVGCAGISGVFKFSWLPTLLGALGLLLSFIGGILEKNRIVESTHVLAAVFTVPARIAGRALRDGGLAELANFRQINSPASLRQHEASAHILRARLDLQRQHHPEGRADRPPRCAHRSIRPAG